jgi:hypothetical protein
MTDNEMRRRLLKEYRRANDENKKCRSSTLGST